MKRVSIGIIQVLPAMRISMHHRNALQLKFVCTGLFLTITTLMLFSKPLIASQNIELQAPIAVQEQGKPLKHKKVVSLAPHITELLYSAGAGEHIVGVVEFSNFPEAAKSKPIIGNYHGINIEKLLQLNPDIIIAWDGGSRLQDIEKLKRLGFNVIFSNPRSLNDISAEITKFATLLGTQKVAMPTIQRIDKTLLNLQMTYANKDKIGVFYQIWQRPLMTINKKQFISQAIELCGARNVFSDLPLLAAEVNIESVLQRNPQIILLGGEKATQETWRKDWQKIKQIEAVNNNHIYKINADLYQRPTERFVMQLEKLCQTIDLAR